MHNSLPTKAIFTKVTAIRRLRRNMLSSSYAHNFILREVVKRRDCGACHTFVLPTKEQVYVRFPCLFVCLFVCLSVCEQDSKITQKRVHGFGSNVACRQMSGHGRTD